MIDILLYMYVQHSVGGATLKILQRVQRVHLEQPLVGAGQRCQSCILWCSLEHPLVGVGQRGGPTETISVISDETVYSDLPVCSAFVTRELKLKSSIFPSASFRVTHGGK